MAGITQQRNLNYINILDLGCIAGVTTFDNGTIIAAAALKAHNNGGGGFFVPFGNFYHSGIPIYDDVYFVGVGPEASILTLINGANADCFSGTANGYGGTMVNAWAANATGSGGGNNAWGLFNLTIDGNKTNQSGTSYGLRVYGLNYKLNNIEIRNCLSGGIYSDWNGGSSVSNTTKDMAAHVSHLKVHDCGGVGILWGGPHDSQFTSIFSYKNDSHGMYVGPNASALVGEQFHPWGSKYAVNAVGLLIEAGYGQWSNCIFEGSDTCQVVVMNGSTNFAGCHAFGTPGGTGFATGGLQIGQGAPSTVLKAGATATPIVLTTSPSTLPPGVQLSFVVTGLTGSGTINVTGGLNAQGAAITDTLTVNANGTYTTANTYANTPTITVSAGITAFTITVNGLGVPYPYSNFQTVPGATSGGSTVAQQAGGCHFTGSFDHCEGPYGAILFANDGGNADIQASIFQTGGTVILSGTPAAGSSYRLLAQGLTATGNINTGGGERIAAISQHALTVASRTTDYFNVDTFDTIPRVEFPNGPVVKGYSDNYTTQKWKLDQFGNLNLAGNILVGQSSTASAIASNGTITTSGIGLARVAPTGNVTGIILQAGSAGQLVTVVNESAFTVTFDVAGTSHVADGVSDVIAATTARDFRYDGGTSLWYRCG